MAAQQLSPREQIIYDGWSDPKQGFINASSLFRKLRDSYPAMGYKAKEVHEVLERIARKQQFEPLNSRLDTRYDSITAPQIRDSYQVDLADMQNLRKQNDNVGYVFLCIDVHSRYALWLPCKTKTTKDVKNCLEAVFATMGKPKNMTSDFESAVLSNEVQAWLTQQGVKHWPVKDEKKRNNAMVERLIRTMREKMQKAFTTYGTRRWIGPMIVDLNTSYNNTYHRIIKATPAQVWNAQAISSQDPRQNEYDLGIGDQVRVRKITGFKDPLMKTSTMKAWSKAVYTITARDGRRFVATNPATGAKTPRMGYELLKVPTDTIEFKPPKDSPYTKKLQSGKQARAERTQLQNEAALKRDDILQSAVQKTVKRLATMQSTRASDSLEKQNKQNAPAPKRLSKAPMTDSFGIDRFVDKRKDAQGRVEYDVFWDDGSTSWEPRAFLNNPKQSKLPTRVFSQLEREYSQQNIE